MSSPFYFTELLTNILVWCFVVLKQEISNAVGEINQQVELYKDKLHSLESLKETIVEEIFHFQGFLEFIL